jgi:hypothetical protein
MEPQTFAIGWEDLGLVGEFLPHQPRGYDLRVRRIKRGISGINHPVRGWLRG